MKRFFFFFFLFIVSQTALIQAFDVEARVAYFYPQDKRIRDIYGKNGFAEYQLEAAMPLSFCCDCECDWDAFVNLAYYQKRGHSSCLGDKTKIENWAINLGVKRYFYICETFRPYLGAGFGAINARFHDQSDFVREHTNRWGVGVLLKSGVKYDVTCNIFLDLFIDYSYHWINTNHHAGVTVRDVNTGGLKVGLGVGYQF